MRGAYLLPRDGDRTCQRGGVGGVYDEGTYGEEYELEIGERSNASFDMLALCAHIDEVKEVLEHTQLGRMVGRSIKQEAQRLERIFDERKAGGNGHS